MYKCFKSKKYRLTFNTFRKSAKKVSNVYKSGFRYWKADDSYNYSIVIGTFRIIFSKEREQRACCG